MVEKKSKTKFNNSGLIVDKNDEEYVSIKDKAEKIDKIFDVEKDDKISYNKYLIIKIQKWYRKLKEKLKYSSHLNTKNSYITNGPVLSSKLIFLF